jgi:hypothetical protein
MTLHCPDRRRRALERFASQQQHHDDDGEDQRYPRQNAAGLRSSSEAARLRFR